MLSIIRFLMPISVFLIFISGLFAQETKTVSGTVTLDPETDNPGKAQKR
jgi:hypothetical protein